jgi:8-oxo-dGTP pyrophosphatase MutT (NUDIX family)
MDISTVMPDEDFATMLDIQNVRINTAGAYVCIEGFYVFAVGILPYKGRIPIVRLGGHREGNETGWQCAVREVYEEANIQIHPISPQTTHLAEWDTRDSELQEIEWHPTSVQEPKPLLVVRYCGESDTHLSLMYLARAEGLPTPSSEVQGLVFLNRNDIHRLCTESITLEQYLDRGGKAMLNGGFDVRMDLEPFAQLRLLDKMLNVQSEISL